MIFGTFCVAGFVHVFLFFQETCNRSLEEIDDIFKNESVWAFKVDSKKPTRFVADVQRAERELENKENFQMIERSV